MNAMHSLSCFVLGLSGFLGVFLGACETLANTLPPEVDWETTLGGAGSHGGRAVALAADGGFVAVGFSRAPGGKVAAYLLKTDPRGGLVWDSRFGKRSASGRDVAPTSDGGYIVVGSNSPELGQNKLYLVKTDENGGPVWEQRFGGDQRRGVCVQPTADGGYVVAGTIHLFPEGYLLKTDAEGELEWERALQAFEAEPIGVTANSVRQTRDGGYIVGGLSLFLEGYLLFYLGRLDSAGNPVWEIDFDSNGRVGLDNESYLVLLRGGLIDETPEGGIVFAGIVRNENAAVLFKFDPGGELLWRRILEGPTQTLDSLEPTSDGGYLLAGRSDPHVIELVKANAVGQQLWRKTLSVNSLSTAGFARQTADGGFIVVGSTTPDSESKVYLAKLFPETRLEKLFVRGDSNHDGAVDISDAVYTLEWLFLGRETPGCVAATNTNGDEAVDISDPVSLLGFLFLGRPAPVDPFPDCGTSDLEADRRLGCAPLPKSCQQ